MYKQSYYKNIGDFGNDENKQIVNNNDKSVFEIFTAEDKSKFVKSAGNSLVVVDVYADWCAPCKKLYPLYVDLTKKYRNVLFAKENVELDLSPNITAVPTFHFFKNGKYLSAISYTGGDINEVERRISKYGNDS